MIYKLLIGKSDKLYITQLDKEFEGDTYFPEIDEKQWKIVNNVEGPKDDNDFEYSYIDYQRI